MKIQLEHAEALPDATIEELSRTLLSRFGLLPRKKDGSAAMHKLLLELYERKKVANRDRKPEAAVVPVDMMGNIVGIKRQTMYEYLHRWLDLQILKKTSFVADGKVVVGYELNGANLEGAFRKAEAAVKNHLDSSLRIVDILQNEIKKDKLRQGFKENAQADTPDAVPDAAPQ